MSIWFPDGLDGKYIQRLVDLGRRVRKVPWSCSMEHQGVVAQILREDGITAEMTMEETNAVAEREKAMNHGQLRERSQEDLYRPDPSPVDSLIPAVVVMGIFSPPAILFEAPGQTGDPLGVETFMGEHFFERHNPERRSVAQNSEAQRCGVKCRPECNATRCRAARRNTSATQHIVADISTV